MNEKDNEMCKNCQCFNCNVELTKTMPNGQSFSGKCRASCLYCERQEQLIVAGCFMKDSSNTGNH